MSNTESPEAKELGLVGKVEMRIAMAPNDSTLEKTLDTYLAPLLLKLASEYISVRNKVSDVSCIVDDHFDVTIFPSVISPAMLLLKTDLWVSRSFPYVNMSIQELNPRKPPPLLLYLIGWR